MTKTPIYAILVISVLLISSISLGTIVFADDDYDKNEYRDSHGDRRSSDSRMYVNSLSFEFDNRELYDSCTVKTPPCIMIDPLDMDNEIFIVDSELQNTRTLIQLNVHEQDNFPSEINDIFDFPECYLMTLAHINGFDGVLVECNSIKNGVIDVTYSFSGPDQNFIDDDYDDDDYEHVYKDRKYDFDDYKHKKHNDDDR